MYSKTPPHYKRHLSHSKFDCYRCIYGTRPKAGTLTCTFLPVSRSPRIRRGRTLLGTPWRSSVWRRSRRTGAFRIASPRRSRILSASMTAADMVDASMVLCKLFGLSDQISSWHFPSLKFWCDVQHVQCCFKNAYVCIHLPFSLLYPTSIASVHA